MMFGFVIAAYHLPELEATSITTGELIDLTPGSTLSAPGGLFVYEEVPTLAVNLIGGRAIILSVEYEKQHIVSGHPAKIGFFVSEVRIEGVKFHDPDDRISFGHVLDLGVVEGRRSSSRGECLTNSEFPRKYAVMRAMRKELNHLLPMDTAYICTETTMRSMAKRVIKAHQSDDVGSLYSKAERLMLQNLEQAIKYAIFHRAPHHVTHGIVDNKCLYRKINIAGELHYDACKPLRMFALIDVSVEGVPSMAPKQ